jgi:hypothetical protein
MRTAATKTDRLAARACFIPAGATMRFQSAAGAVYTYEANGVCYGLAFRGSAMRPEWHYRFRSVERRDEQITTWLQGLEASQARKDAEQAARRVWTPTTKPGDILVRSWGYDQTNVDFYVVTRVRGRAVWLRTLAHTEIEATQSMAGYVSPLFLEVVDGEPVMRPRPVGEEFRGTATQGGVTVTKRGGKAREWDGRPCYESTYA